MKLMPRLCLCLASMLPGDLWRFTSHAIDAQFAWLQLGLPWLAPNYANTSTTTGSHIAHVDVSACLCVCVCLVCVLLKVIIRNARFHVLNFFLCGSQQGRKRRAVGFEGSPYCSQFCTFSVGPKGIISFYPIFFLLSSWIRIPCSQLWLKRDLRMIRITILWHLVHRGY